MLSAQSKAKQFQSSLTSCIEQSFENSLLKQRRGAHERLEPLVTGRLIVHLQSLQKYFYEVRLDICKGVNGLNDIKIAIHGNCTSSTPGHEDDEIEG